MSNSTFIPLNRHVLVQRTPTPTEENTTGILLPDDYTKTVSLHELVTVVGSDPNSNLHSHFEPGTKIMVLSRFLEDIDIMGESHTIILENHVVGTIGTGGQRGI
jgi:co-chaperonin GroES (HSP10)